MALNAKLDKPAFDLRCLFDLVLEFDKFDIGLEWALNAKLDNPLGLEFDVEFDVVFEFSILRVGMAYG